MRIAFYTPVNPVQSGVSDYSEHLLPWLARHAEIDLFLDGYKPANEAIAKQFKVVDASKSGAVNVARGYDVVLYQMGNSPAHAYMLRALEQLPGVVVLHDFVLHHLMIWMAVNRRMSKQYLATMEREYGQDGLKIGQKVLRGQLPEAMFRFPLCEDVVRKSQAMIVHSQHVERLVKEIQPGLPVQKVNMGVVLPELIDSSVARKRLGIRQETFVVASFGHLNRYKRLDSALRAFAAFSQEVTDSLYLLVGSASPNYNVKRVIDLLNLNDRVRVTGYTPADVFADCVAASDVCVNLRYPTAGESSAALLDIMGAGKSVLISATGSFEEMPDGACAKVSVDDFEEEMILEYLLTFCASPSLRRRLGANARAFVQDRHTVEGFARGYMDLLNRIASPKFADHDAPLPRTRTEEMPLLEIARGVHSAPSPQYITDLSGPSSAATDGSTVGGTKGPTPDSNVSGQANLSASVDLLLTEVADELVELGFTEDDDQLLGEVARSIQGAGLGDKGTA
jgi:glycosyltransferase involved in cell wall biosynthesis